MSERLIAAVDALELVICERYNVSSLTGVGPFAEALAQARVGNVGPISDALRGREMYRWRETTDAALAAVCAAATPEEVVETSAVITVETVLDTEASTHVVEVQEPEVTLTESGEQPRRRSNARGRRNR